MIFRTISGIIVFLSIVYGYWWITWLLAIILLFYIPNYYEIIAWGIVYDALYGAKLPMFYNIKYIFTIFSITIFLISFYLRKRLIIYD